MTLASADVVPPKADLKAVLSASIEEALRSEIERAAGQGTPPRLREALSYALFPGGARLRPLLCLAVAAACSSGERRLQTVARARSSAAALELVHCASLVHDDMPCFDDAELRRGKPTVHRRFGEATALLVGDALIVMAFDAIARGENARAVSILAQATGPSRGIIAGQAWESEPVAPLDEYHRAKTAALFEAAGALGALAAGDDPEPWRGFGEVIGRAYQAADDLADAVGDVGTLGKMPGRDAALGRPSIVRCQGVQAARARVDTLVREARRRIPPCTDHALILHWLDAFAERALAL